MIHDESHLTAKDICAILRACASNGVREFKLGSLHAVFGSKAIDQGDNTKSKIPAETQLELPIPEEPNTEEADLATPQDDYLLAVTDPIEWERRQLEEEQNG